MSRSGTIVAVAAITLLATTMGATAQEEASVDVVDVAFEPADVTIEAGGTVTWEQTGSLPHTVTADDGSFDSHPDCSGGSDCMASGDTFARAFDEPGTYAYYCKLHGGPGGTGMAGTVTVTAAGATATPTDTATPSETETAPPTTGDISVSDQAGDGTTVTVDSVTISGADGFVVVHLDEDGAPGPVLGHVAIDEGTTTDVVVTLDEPLGDDATVWPMLHVDAGVLGTYEFPGADAPVTADGQVVVAALDYTVEAAADDADTADDELATTGAATPLWLLAFGLVLAGTAMVVVRRRTS